MMAIEWKYVGMRVCNFLNKRKRNQVVLAMVIFNYYLIIAKRKSRQKLKAKRLFSKSQDVKVKIVQI